MYNIPQLILTILLLAGAVALQIFLSKRESRIPGLILPGIALVVSFLFILLMAVPEEGTTAGFILQMAATWLLCNIPTAVLLAIYFGCRGKQRRDKQLERMNIQDLD